MFFSQRFYKAFDAINTYEKHVNAPYVRKAFSLKGVAAASVSVGATGFYELFVNGHKITKGLLAPYISNPDDTVYYDSYDVTETEGAAGTKMRSYMLVLQDENGNVADEAIRREVYETLKEAGYDIYYDECGELIVRGDPEELKIYLEQLKYSYELIEQ